MKNIILRIDGMSCSACSNGLEKYLNSKHGIKASVNLVMATANITYDEKLDIKTIEKYIEEAGFKSLGAEKKLSKEEKVNILPHIIFGILGVFIMYYTMSHMLKLPEIINIKENPKLYSSILFLLTIPFIIYSYDIIKSGIRHLFHLMPNMDTLVTIGIISSYSYSIFSLIMVLLNNHYYVHNLYFESTIFVIYFIKLGRFITEKSRDKTKQDIKDLVKITPEKTHFKTENGYKDITIDEVKINDILICLPGERVAVDGEIVKGTSNFDESLITGESQLINKNVGAKVIAGSINYEGQIEYKAEKIGKESTISEIVRLVVEAANSKAPIAKIADKICSYFVPGVLIISTLTFIVNIILSNTLAESLTRFVTVLVVACPCSLGLATPLALVVAVGLAAKKGILIKDSESLEIASEVDTVIFDKTGTLTNGLPTISTINNHSDIEEKQLLNILGSMEKYSSHPLAKGINKYVKDEKIKTTYELTIEDLQGYGIKAKDDNNIYYAGNEKLLEKLDIINSYKEETKKMMNEGNTVIYLVRNKKLLATIGLKDDLRKEAKSIIKKIKDRNINVLILSGDNDVVTQKQGKELSITKENIYSSLTPKQKHEIIAKIINEKHKVMMVGDGINDAPSLTVANVGVSLNSGTDIATNAANIVLIDNNLLKIEELIKLSRRTIINIKQNLFWAFIYNLLMVPVAQGMISFIKINPMIACIAMIISSLTVTLNALRLKIKK